MTVERIEVKLAAEDVDAETGAFGGYGAVFGNVDSYGDVIERGAFASTLGEWSKRGKLPPMLLQHGSGLTVDDRLPIGVWTEMQETAKGLRVAGRLHGLGTQRGTYIHEGLKSGALDGLSIGYLARKFTMGTKPGEPRRRLQDLELVEVSVVTFPANPKARVTAAKAAGLDAEEKRDLEAALRTQGLSRADAAKAVSGIHHWLRRDAEGDVPVPRDEDAAALADLIRRNISILT